MQPTQIYYEPKVLEYDLGKKLYEKYKKLEWTPIDSHNNIEELRSKENKEFEAMKRLLILGIRKTHKYSPNQKVSDYLVPFTSSGCSAMCLYCYLVCNYNKCSYLRIFANREEMMERLVRFSNKSEKDLTFEIGSNSDLILENMITDNLPFVIEQFVREGKGNITFPTKFSMVDDLLTLDHQNKVIFRMSVNPNDIIRDIEIGTASLKNRIEAINKMVEADYKVGILIAPVIFVDDWKKQYSELLDILNDTLSTKMKNQMFIEIIFMTYSFVHRKINNEAFPEAIELYSKEYMIGRGMGKYCYRQEFRQDGEMFLKEEVEKRFGKGKILYFS